VCSIYLCRQFSVFFYILRASKKKKLDLLPQNRVSTVLQNLELSGDFTSVFFFFSGLEKSYISICVRN